MKRTAIAPESLRHAFQNPPHFCENSFTRRCRTGLFSHASWDVYNVSKTIHEEITAIPERILDLVKVDGVIYAVTNFFIGYEEFPHLMYVTCDDDVHIMKMLEDFCRNVIDLGVCSAADIEGFIAAPNSRGLLSEKAYEEVRESGKVRPITNATFKKWLWAQRVQIEETFKPFTNFLKEA